MSHSTTQTTESSHAVTPPRTQSRFAELAGAPICSIAHAPVAFDVMGGIAELTGALTLAAPARQIVRAAVAPRNDESLRIVSLPAPSAARAQRNGHEDEITWPLSSFYSHGATVPPHTLEAQVAALTNPVHRAAVAAAHALLAGKLVSHLAGGFTLVIESDDADETCAHYLAAVVGAAGAALARALGEPADARRLAVAFHKAQNSLLAQPTGIMTQAGCLLAQPGALLQVCCDTFDVGESIPVAAGVTLVGIDCGARHPRAVDKYAAAVTAAAMGREIITRLMPVVCKSARWDGHLARVSVTDFVDHLRDRIPTKMKGADYLDRFGPLETAPAKIDPRAVYKVRSRAEHHIYEDDRVRQFAERVVRARRSGDESAIREAGELMYASHWSYGQRCGLGSIETDLLVGLLRTEGADRGIFGARVSGMGCGGTVVVLLRDDAIAASTVERVVAAYTERLGRKAVVRPIADDGASGLTVEQPA